MSSSQLSHWSPRSLGLAVVLFATNAHGLENSDATLTLSDALQRATENNPSLVAERFSERAAEALIEQAGLRPNPTVDVTLENFAGTGSVRDVDRLESTVQASQTIERGDKREKRIALAMREHESAASEMAVRRSEVLASTALAYVEVLAAEQRLTLAEEPLKLARETVAAANARVSAAASSTAGAARARAEFAAAQANYARAKAKLAVARAHLALSWGGVGTELGTLTGKLTVPESLPTQESFSAKMFDHPRIAHQRAVISGRRAALDVEKSHSVQDVTVGGGLRFLRESSDAALVAGVSMPLPFRNKNQGNIRAARERLLGAEQSERNIEMELRAAFAAAWQELTVAFETAWSLRSEALPSTEEAYSTVRHAYEQGQLAQTEVLHAQGALVSLRDKILEAELAYNVSLVRIESLTDPTYASLVAQLSSSQATQP